MAGDERPLGVANSTENSQLDADNGQRILRAARALCGVGVEYDKSHRNDGWQNLKVEPKALNCSGFVCRVAAHVIGESFFHDCAVDAHYLLKRLPSVSEPQEGDVVGYWRWERVGPDEDEVDDLTASLPGGWGDSNAAGGLVDDSTASLLGGWGDSNAAGGLARAYRRSKDPIRVWHVMIYAGKDSSGNHMVVGACEDAKKVTERRMEYGDVERWKLVAPGLDGVEELDLSTAFRRLRVEPPTDTGGS